MLRRALPLELLGSILPVRRIMPQRWRRDCGRLPIRVPQISTLEPLARLAALADAGDLQPLAAAGASPYLSRWGIAPAVDDGVVCARLEIGGTRVLALGQDSRVLGARVGAQHRPALRRRLPRSHAETPAPRRLV